MKLFALLTMALTCVLVASAAHAAGQTISIDVTEKGFVPATVKVKANEDVTLRITRTTVETCATVIQIPSLNVRRPLPLGKTVTLNLGKLAQGDIKFGCAMDMMESGVIVAR